MEMKNKGFILGSALVMIMGGAQADTFGYGGASIGLSKAHNFGDRDKNQAGFGTVSGAVATDVGANGTVVLEALLREDKHRGDIVSNGQETKTQYQIGAHYLHDIGDNKLGVFLAYSDSPHEGNNENYRAVFGGVEGIFATTDETSIYAQLAYGDAHNDGASSRGFENGYVGRLGGAYKGFTNTLLKVEAEMAKNSGYEDAPENGYLRKYSLLGETGINSDNSLVLTYGVSYAKFISSGDPDTIEEKRINVGFRYYFGGTSSTKAFDSGLIGVPSIILDSMNWVPTLD